MFKPLPDCHGAEVTVVIDGRQVRVPATVSAAAAMLIACDGATRTTPVSGAPRAPYCMMGVCFECLMEIDGVPNRQGCLIPVTEGMRINRQLGTREVKV